MRSLSSMGSETAPRVSVVVPVFNEPASVLAESLASVREQTFADFECLVIDESTDPQLALACRSICELDSRFQYIHPPQRIGLAASLNLGVERARGGYIARFDSDDICLPQRLASQLAFLDAHAEVGVLGGELEIMSDDGRTLAYRNYPQDHATIERRMQSTTSVAHPTVMIRKSLFLAHGGYDPQFRFAEDLDLWLRFINLGVRFANLGEVLVRYRQNSTARNPSHWHFNRKARLHNWHPRHLHLRLIGVVAITIWAWFPVRWQERVFKPLLLRHER
jgi:glycosyltransferase involved in cell wall biosynthesis